MKKVICFRIGILMVMAFTSTLAVASGSFDSLCDYSNPLESKVTYNSNRSIYVCSWNYAVYITDRQALEGAILVNTNKANVVCPSGFIEGGPRRYRIYPSASTSVISTYRCK